MFVLDRHHVLDMLPNVWMLDGRLVTGELGSQNNGITRCSFRTSAAERKKVEEFFNESESSSHPVVSTGHHAYQCPETFCVFVY